MPFKLVLRSTIERKEFTLTYMAGFCVVGPLGGLLGHGVASTIGGAASLGLMKKEDAIRFPSEESYPNPPMEYRVSFVDHLIRGLSAPIHDFISGLLFVY